jgi:hypothetical protein
MGNYAPPTPPTPDVPDIPIPNFSDTAGQLLSGWKKYGMFGDFWAHWIAAAGPFLINLLDWLVTAEETVATVLMQQMTKAQGTQSPEFYAFVAAMISDLLGVEIDATKMQMAWAQHGDVAGMKAIGTALWDQLVKEFNPPNPLTPDGGKSAATAFIGYLLAFSVREANVATMVSMLPECLRMMDGLREYAVDMARNLGLGRLARRALQPLIQTVIADPLQWHLNQFYRPKLLSEGLAVKAWVRGQITEGALNDILQRTGYTDAAIAAVKTDTYIQPSENDYYILYKYGGFDDQTVIDAISQRGTAPYLASLQLAAEQYRDAETEISSYLSTLESQRVDGYITQADLLTALDALPISPQQKLWFRQRVGQRVEYPHSHCTLAEYQSAYVAGIIDLSDLQKALSVFGYSNSDQDVLVNLTLLKLAKTEYAAAKAEWTWLKAVATAQKKGETPPPKPPGIT